MQKDGLHNATGPTSEEACDKLHQQEQTKEQDEYLEEIDFLSGVTWKKTDQAILEVNLVSCEEDKSKQTLEEDIKVYQELEMEEEELFKDMDFMSHINFFKDVLIYRDSILKKKRKHSLRSYCKKKFISFRQKCHLLVDEVNKRQYTIIGVAASLMVIGVFAWGVNRVLHLPIAFASNQKEDSVIWSFEDSESSKDSLQTQEVLNEEQQAIKEGQTIENVDSVVPDRQTVDSSAAVTEQTEQAAVNPEVITPSQEVAEQSQVVAEPPQERNNSYFDDALFIGNSRTVGLRNMTGLTNAEFMAVQSLSVNNALKDPFVNDTESGQKITLFEALKKQEYNKIYINFGVNELGWGSETRFQEEYKTLVESIRELQPQAVIYIQSIIPVTKERSDKDKIFNNLRISLYNTIIKEMCDQLQVRYLDVASGIADSEGNLPEGAANDGIHLTKEYCNLWLEQIKKLS